MILSSFQLISGPTNVVSFLCSMVLHELAKINSRSSMMRTFLLTFSILLVGCGDKETDATTVVPDNSAKLQASLEEALAEIVVLKHANAKLAADFDSATNTISGLHKRIDLMNAERQAPPPNANNPEVAQLKAVIEQQKNFIMQLRGQQPVQPKPAVAGVISGHMPRESWEALMTKKTKNEVLAIRRPSRTFAPQKIFDKVYETWTFDSVTYDRITGKFDHNAQVTFQDGVVDEFRYTPSNTKTN